MDICGGTTLFLPTSECDECESLLSRIRALEEQLAGKEDIELVVKDKNGTVTATVLGSAEYEEEDDGELNEDLP